MNAQADGAASVTIPDDVRTKFPELIELVLGSESMNDEERQYWINILPIMTPEQIQNLRNILDNERTQLAAIDKKYAAEIEKIGGDPDLKKAAQDRAIRRQKRQKQETEDTQNEEQAAEDLLKQINEI